MSWRQSLQLTDEERIAVAAATLLRRKRTGERVAFVDLVREGLRSACEREGVAWPLDIRSHTL